MKSAFLAFWLSGLAVLSACDQAITPTAETDEPVAVPVPTIPKQNITRAIEALKAEPKILHVWYNPDRAVEWTIGVADDGTRRTGYAEYVCSVLSQQAALGPADDVRIVDDHRFLNGNDASREASLGHVECANGRDLGV